MAHEFVWWCGVKPIIKKSNASTGDASGGEWLADCWVGRSSICGFMISWYYWQYG